MKINKRRKTVMNRKGWSISITKNSSDCNDEDRKVLTFNDGVIRLRQFIICLRMVMTCVHYLRLIVTRPLDL